jgi:CheY-like chemotaxis protein
MPATAATFNDMTAVRATPARSTLHGLRVLVVEDESIVSFLLEDMLSELGCRVIGLASNVRQALAMLAQERPDAAVLDVNLRGELAFPIADRLQSDAVPFLFATGYGAPGIPERWRQCPVVQKPFRLSELASALEAAVAPRTG